MTVIVRFSGTIVTYFKKDNNNNKKGSLMQTTTACKYVSKNLTKLQLQILWATRRPMH